MQIVFEKEEPQAVVLTYVGPGQIGLKACLEREQAAWARGHEAYAHEQGKQKAKLLEQYATLLKNLEKKHNQLEETLHAQLPEVLTALAQRVWGEASFCGESLKAKIDELLAPLKDATAPLALRLSPQDKALFESEKLQQHYPRLRLEEDPQLGPGDLQLETPLGLIDARVRTQLQTAVDSL